MVTIGERVKHQESMTAGEQDSPVPVPAGTGTPPAPLGAVGVPAQEPGWREGYFLGNRWEAWALSVLLALLLLVVFTRARRAVAARAAKIAQGARHETGALVARLVATVSVVVVVLVALHLASLVLVLPARAERIRHYVLVAALALQAATWVRELVDFGIAQFVRRRAPAGGEPDPALRTTIAAARVILLLFAYALVALVAAQNMGMNVTAMIAGLGIGGVAIALAVQKILSDLFGSVSIVLDKPFVIGDFIVVGDLMGTVEKIGLKTTRLRALSGEQLVLPNSDLLAGHIRNYKRMAERRVVFGVGVVYDTPVALVERAREIVASAVRAQSGVRLDRCHFHRFGPSSLDIEAVYHVEGADYKYYMDRQQAINLRILEEFRAEGIVIAYPTQTLYVVRTPGKDPPRADSREGRQQATGAGP